MEINEQEENSEERVDGNATGELYGDYSQEFSQDVDVLDDSNDSIVCNKHIIQLYVTL